MIVPVMVNGKGPFEFALDTGSSRTMIDPSLAAQLAVEANGNEEVTSITRSLHIPLGRLAEISLAAAAVKDLDVGIASLAGLKSAHAHARGILGEDFCGHFDFLLDNTHRTLTFERGANALLQGIRGERLEVQQRGSVEGLPTAHRLIVTIKSAELGAGGLAFQLDSGATLPILFPGRSSEVAAAPEPDMLVVLATTAERENTSTFRVRRLRVLQVGKKLLSGVLLAMPDTREKMDTDGLLPTCIFRSIYISHSAGFIIVNPDVVRSAAIDPPRSSQLAGSGPGAP